MKNNGFAIFCNTLFSLYGRVINNIQQLFESGYPGYHLLFSLLRILWVKKLQQTKVLQKNLIRFLTIVKLLFGLQFEKSVLSV